ncbi:serine/threonine-protein kinase [Sorangium sp. So ce131]|uniref:serine/threonine-protein kinase n=1 Tax=Sorangium sp. So ce131 TaxID=3133282 RepID=UPI003F6054C5
MALFDDDFETLEQLPEMRKSRGKGGDPHGQSPTPVNPGRARAELSELTGDDPRYEVRSLLGVGGMGEVHFCRDRRIGRDVAMKVIRAEHQGDATLRHRFIREARVQGQLEHPSIVPVYDLGVDPKGSAYFTMKRLRGLTLARILNELREGDAAAVQSFSRRKLLTAFSSICLAVDFAHSRGVLHRDLKPANIMLGDFGEVYLLDWGVAKLIDTPLQTLDMGEDPMSTRTIPGDVLGTLGYMSPEQAQGCVDTLDPRSDVYSLGSILFELLTLKPLHPKKDRSEMLDSLIHGADARASVRAPEREVPPELDAICVRATRRDPADRYPSARALYEAVEGFLDGDRDVELRRDLAARHAGMAEEKVLQALAGGQDAESARKTLLSEVGQALALDPSNERALETLRRILTEPPREMPQEVLAELDAAAAARHRLQLHAGIRAELLATAIATAVAALWLGVRDWKIFGFILGFTALAALMKFVAIRVVHRPSAQWYAYAGFVFNVLSFLCIGRGFGPLLFMPMLLVIFTYGNSLTYRTAYRVAIVVTGCLALLAAVWVEYAGLVPRSYEFSEGAMIILPQAVAHSKIPTMTALTLTTLFMLVVPAFMMGQHQQALRDAERRAFLQAWQLRQLLPERAQSGAVAGPRSEQVTRRSAKAPQRDGVSRR